MATCYKPPDPVVVAPEHSQVMTTQHLPPAHPNQVQFQEDELESNNHESSESHSAETPSTIVAWQQLRLQLWLITIIKTTEAAHENELRLAA